MNVRATLEGATLAVMLVLAAYSIPAPTKAVGARRDVVPEIDATGLLCHSTVNDFIVAPTASAGSVDRDVAVRRARTAW